MGVYNPTTWAPGSGGTEITTTRLQNLEIGVGGAHTELNALAGTVSGKVSTPGGGADGQVLVKAGSAAAWAAIPNTLTVESFTADTTLSADSKDVVEVNSASPTTVTVPITVPYGRSIEVYQAGAGAITLAPGLGVTLRTAPPATGVKTPGQFGSVIVRSKTITPVTSPPASLMLLRYKGDDNAGANASAVSSWPESSGNSHPAAAQATGANQPTVLTNAGGSGHKGVLFDGTNDFLSLSGSALAVAQNRAALTVFIALALPTSVATGTRTLLALSSGTSSTQSRVAVGQRDSGSATPYAGGRRLDANSLATITGSAGITGTVNATVTSRFLFSSSDLYLYRDGTQIGSSTSFQTDGSTSDTASLAGTIGADAGGASGQFQGAILEILVYNDADTSGALRTQVHSYFQNTYGIAAPDALTAEMIISGGIA